MIRNRDDVVVGVVGAVLGTVLLFGALQIPSDSNAFSVMGPQVAPLAISIAMILCSLAILATGLWPRQGGFEEEPADGSAPAGAAAPPAEPQTLGDGVLAEREREDEGGQPLGGRAVVTVLLFAIYIAVLIPVGYILSTFAFLMALTSYVAPRKVVRNLVYAACFSVAVYYLFGRVLQVQLPAGLLG